MPRRPLADRCYRLLGAGGVRLTTAQIEALVESGLITPETKVVRDGEAFAVPLSARPEFQRLRGSLPILSHAKQSVA